MQIEKRPIANSAMLDHLAPILLVASMPFFAIFLSSLSVLMTFDDIWLKRRCATSLRGDGVCDEQCNVASYVVGCCFDINLLYYFSNKQFFFESVVISIVAIVNVSEMHIASSIKIINIIIIIVVNRLCAGLWSTNDRRWPMRPCLLWFVNRLRYLISICITFDHDAIRRIETRWHAAMRHEQEPRWRRLLVLRCRLISQLMWFDLIDSWLWLNS